MRKHKIIALYIGIYLVILGMLFCFGGCALDGRGAKDNSTKTDVESNGSIAKSGLVYVAEKVKPELPEGIGYQRFLMRDGRIFGVDEQGLIRGNDDFPKNINLTNVTDLLITEDRVFLVSRAQVANGVQAVDGSQVANGGQVVDGTQVANGAQMLDGAQPDTVLVYNNQGELQGKIVCAGNEVTCIIAEGAYILRRSGEYGELPVINRLDAGQCKLGEELENVPQDCRGIAKLGNDADTLYLYTADSLLRYSWKEKTFAEVFSWTDVGLQGSFVQMVWKMAESFYVASWDGDAKDLVYHKVSEAKEGERPKRKELVIATLQSDSNLQQLVTDFNNSQQEYSVKIQKLTDIKDSNQQDALTRLGAMLLTKDAPDMLWLQNVNDRESLAEKGYLTDLRPFLEKSEKLSENDFYPEILSYGSCGDLLYTIPYQFSLETLAVPESLWEKGAGWTYPEMVEYLRGLEEYRPFRDFMLMKMWLFNYNLDYFYDEEKGEAYFDSADFRTLLEYMKECHDKENLVAREDSVFHVEYFSMQSLQYLYTEERDLGEKILLVGFPTRDGSPRSTISGSMEVAIVHSCEDKEGAWSFMESYLSAYPKESMFPQYALWSNQNTMQTLIDKELPLFGLNKVEYKDEEGNVTKTDFSEHLLNQEGVDAFLEALSAYRKNPTDSRSVSSIVYEETGAYFEGQKSLEEVVDVIQNRVTLMLQEK